jgi:hypothetical protein
MTTLDLPRRIYATNCMSGTDSVSGIGAAVRLEGMQIMNCPRDQKQIPSDSSAIVGIVHRASTSKQHICKPALMFLLGFATAAVIAVAAYFYLAALGPEP